MNSVNKIGKDVIEIKQTDAEERRLRLEWNWNFRKWKLKIEWELTRLNEHKKIDHEWNGMEWMIEIINLLD